SGERSLNGLPVSTKDSKLFKLFSGLRSSPARLLIISCLTHPSPSIVSNSFCETERNHSDRRLDNSERGTREISQSEALMSNSRILSPKHWRAKARHPLSIATPLL